MAKGKPLITNLVFHKSCAAFTFIFAVSAVNGGSGGLVVVGAVEDAMFLVLWYERCDCGTRSRSGNAFLYEMVQDFESKLILFFFPFLRSASNYIEFPIGTNNMTSLKWISRGV